MDLETGQYENLGTFRNPANDRPIGIYGIYADQQNNAYILEFPQGGIGKIDAKTGKLAFYVQDRRRPTRGRGAGASIPRTGCGSPSTAATASACSIPRPRRSPNGRSRWRGRRPGQLVADRNGEAWETRFSSPTKSAGSIPAPAHGRIISCRAMATFAGCSSTIGIRR